MKIANVLLSNVWGEVGPEALERGIGGREGAMLYLSREWARLGHQVTSFVNVDRGKTYYEEDAHSFGVDGFHEYVPLNMTKGMLSNFDWDAVIAWECPSVFKDEAIRERAKIKAVEMQVAHMIDEDLVHASEYCDFVCALSNWHGQFLLHQGLKIDPSKVVTLPNGVDLSRYSGPKKKWTSSGKPTFVYSSSPDRGLWHLLRGWRQIRRYYPSAELYVGYGATNWTSEVKWSHGRVGEMALEIEGLMHQPGVTDIGKVGQKDLSYLQKQATAWLYPFDPIQPTETGCITAIENAAAGNPLVISDGDCLEEEFGEIAKVVPLPLVDDNIDRFMDEAKEVLMEPECWAEYSERGLEFAQTRDWSKIAPAWIELFENGQ